MPLCYANHIYPTAYGTANLGRPHLGTSESGCVPGVAQADLYRMSMIGVFHGRPERSSISRSLGRQGALDSRIGALLRFPRLRVRPRSRIWRSRRIASGPRTASPRPESEPEQRSIVLREVCEVFFELGDPLCSVGPFVESGRHACIPHGRHEGQAARTPQPLSRRG